MIGNQTNLKILDNSGVKELCSIQILEGSKKKKGKIGSKLIGSVKSSIFKNKTKIRNGAKAYSVVIQQIKKFRRQDGSSFSFEKNRSAIINTKNHPLCTKISGLALYDLRIKGFTKLSSLAKRLV